MIHKIEDIRVAFSPEKNDAVNAAIEAFVRDVSGTGSVAHYEGQRAASWSRVELNHFGGKKAEFFAAEAFRLLGLPLLEPDLEVYPKGRKNWGADLPFSRHDPSLWDVHVKACTRSTFNLGRDFSWTFQLRDLYGPGGRDRLFDQPRPSSQAICLVYLDHETSPEGVVKAILPWDDLRDHLGDPVLRKFADCKRCAYYETVRSL